jgi:putative ATP-binding cassette transporter
LDEATNALDAETEEALYELLFEQLPHAAIVTISHNASLAARHTQSMDLSAASTLDSAQSFLG